MRSASTTLRTTGLLLALLLLAGRGLPSRVRPAKSQGETVSSQEQVRTEARAFLTHYKKTIEGDDSEAIRELFVDDGRFAWFTDGERRYTSADEVLAGLAGLEGMTFSTDVSEVEVVPLTTGLAHARTAFHTKLHRGGAVVFEFDGVTTWLLERQKDGEWRVVTGHTSTPKQR